MLKEERPSQADPLIREPVLEAAEVLALKASLRGKLLQPDDESYDVARRGYNAMIDKHPALIVRCAGVSDVINTVNFARSHKLRTVVRGGGHSVAGKSTCDGGVVIDLSSMKGIRVDPVGRIARAEPGVTWNEFDQETQAFGLASTGGTISTTGIAGLTLGGGLGWLMRKYGLACDNLLSVDIVLGDGRFLTASATENVDLFWGIRGAGANFGVVTSFEYKLHPVGSILGGKIIYPMENAREVLQFYRNYTAEAPEELAAFAVLRTLPDGQPAVVILVCYNGQPEVGEKVLQPLRKFCTPIDDQITSMTYLQLQTMLDEGFPSGLHNYWKTNFLRDLGDDVIEAILSYFATVPSELTAILIEQLGGAVARIGQNDTAFSPRDQRFNLSVVSRWTEPGEPEKHKRWTREFWDLMHPFATDAVYVNYLAEDEGERVKDLYGATKYEQLIALKHKYDQENFF